MRPLVLTGPPGGGKSTVAPCLAALLGVDWVDLDQVVERTAGTSVARLFATEGEAGFRAREAAALALCLNRPGMVIAAGGGALVSAGVRRDALHRATVVCLTAPLSVLLARVLASGDRPLVQGAPDPAGALETLVAARAAGYAEAHITVDTAAVTPDQVAAQVAHELAWDPLVVPLGSRSYPVWSTSMASVGEILAALPGRPVGKRVVVTDTTVWRHWGRAFRAGLGVRPDVVVALTPGERAKRLASVQRIWDGALGAGVDRDAVVVALGGGVVTDLAGFAASTLLRGLRVVSVPTTLLAMADAAVGGKTGFDHALGKNLLGSFHHPSAVLLDIGTLGTLPAAEYTAAMAEVVKIALVRDPVLLDTLERNAQALRLGHDCPGPLLAAVIRAAVQAKANVVAADEREQGERAVLNLGHTIGHAIEAASGYRLRHGTCVAIGMRAALDLGVSLGATPASLRDRVAELLSMLGLPMRARVPADRAIAFLSRDKKRVGGALRFVLVRAPGEAVLQAVDLRLARRATRGAIETR